MKTRGTTAIAICQGPPNKPLQPTSGAATSG